MTHSVDSRWYVAIGLVALTLGLVAEAGAGSSPRTSLVSRQSAAAGGNGADDDSFNPAISANGRFTAFESDGDNLSGADDDTVTNVYVYDAEKRKIELISRRSNGGAGADSSSSTPEISPSGRYVVFSTRADNLGGPLDTSPENVYLYDRATDRTRLVSRRSGRNGAGADDNSFSPALSANGRLVVFSTGADNLGGPIDTNSDNVYVYDLERRKVTLVSRRSGRTGAGGNDHSVTGTLSGNGRYVAFASEATNLGGPLQTGPFDSNIYVYDREQRKVKLVSRRSGRTGAGANGTAEDPFISANGRFVGFETRATNLGGPLLTTPPAFNIYVYDRERSRVQLVSRQSRGAGGQGGDAGSDDPTLSANGRFVAFETDARNLGGPLANTPGDGSVYLYDRDRSRVELISRQSPGLGGDGGNGDDENPHVSSDGSGVAFEATSDNLGGPIDALTNNIYVRFR